MEFQINIHTEDMQRHRILGVGDLIVTFGRGLTLLAFASILFAAVCSGTEAHVHVRYSRSASFFSFYACSNFAYRQLLYRTFNLNRYTWAHNRWMVRCSFLFL